MKKLVNDMWESYLTPEKSKHEIVKRNENERNLNNMLPKPKSEEVMIIVDELLELEKWFWYDKVKETWEGTDVGTQEYYKIRQKELFKQIIDLVDEKGNKHAKSK